MVVKSGKSGLNAIYIPYISTPRAHIIKNIVLNDINGFTHKLYGVRSETNCVTSIGNVKITITILYFHGILFFIVNHHCIKLQDMIRNFKVIL
jgi:hypothetical protein